MLHLTVFRSVSRPAALALTAALLAAGCSQPAESPSRPAEARVDAVSPSGPARITLSEQAARRIDIQSGPVEERTVVRTRTLTGDVVELQPGQVPSVQADSPRVLLDEQFADTPSGWANDSRSTAWFDGETYVVHARQQGRFVALDAPIEPVGDVELTAIFRKLDGPPGGGYGLIIRDQSPATLNGIRQLGHYLVFEVGDDGRFGAWRRDDNRWIDIQPWTASPTIRPEFAPNELKVTQTGDQLEFAINGTPVLQHTLPGASAAPARVGIFVGGDSNAVALERFTARSIAAAAPPPVATLGVRTTTLTPGELAQIDVGQPATVTSPGGPLVTTSPVPGTTGPRSASGSGTLIYPLTGAVAGLNAGDRVPMEIVLTGNQAQRKVVPQSAVIYDQAGAPWVYVNPNPFVFERQPISIETAPGGITPEATNGSVVLSRGPEPGTSIVVVGAAQLYGIERSPTDR